jgi:flagellar hook-length control protein FliK
MDNTAAISPVLPQLTTPVQDTAWGDRLGDRLMMMADSKLQFAEIRLTPAELGPLRIQVSIDDGAASVTFHAQHVVTREALEQAMPRLRELFADNGLTLAESHVRDAGEQGVPQGKPEQRDRADEGAALLSDGEISVTPESAADRFRPRPRADQLLDTFA